MKSCNNPKNTLWVGGWVGQVKGRRQQRQLNSETPCDLKTPSTLKPILLAVCEKSIFCIFRPQPAENHTFYSTAPLKLPHVFVFQSHYFEPVVRSFSAGEISRQPAVRDIPGPLSLPIYLETLSRSNWSFEILFGFWGEGKTPILGDKTPRVETKTNNNNNSNNNSFIYPQH